MGCKQSVVDRGDNCEDAYFLSPLAAWYERRCESLPYCGCVEREQELDRRAGKQRCQNSVYGSVDMVKWEDVEEVVVLTICPGFNKGL